MARVLYWLEDRLDDIALRPADVTLKVGLESLSRWVGRLGDRLRGKPDLNGRRQIVD